MTYEGMIKEETLLALKTEKEDQESKNVGSSGSGKTKETYSPRASRKEYKLTITLIFNPMRVMVLSYQQN